MIFLVRDQKPAKPFRTSRENNVVQEKTPRNYVVRGDDPRSKIFRISKISRISLSLFLIPYHFYELSIINDRLPIINSCCLSLATNYWFRSMNFIRFHHIILIHMFDDLSTHTLIWSIRDVLVKDVNRLVESSIKFYLCIILIIIKRSVKSSCFAPLLIFLTIKVNSQKLSETIPHTINPTNHLNQQSMFVSLTYYIIFPIS